LDVDLGERALFHENFQFELVLKIFVLDEDRVVPVVYFYIPRQKDQLSVVVGIKV